MERQACCFLAPAPNSCGAKDIYFSGWEGALCCQLRALISAGSVPTFISDLTPGLGLLGAEMVLELRQNLPAPPALECIVPGAGQIQRLTAQERCRVNSVLARCQRKTLLWTSATYMVDSSRLVLSLPGAPGLDHARQEGLEILLLTPQ